MIDSTPMDKTPSSVIRPEIRNISAYHVPDSRGFIKLDAMENPYGLPPDLRREIGTLVANASVNRYPDPSAAALKTQLRIAMDVPDDLELLLGNGSDELIQILALAVGRPGAVLMSLEPSFVMFRMVATLTGLGYVGVPLADGFELDAGRVCAEIARAQPALIFIAYPNNPTGNLFDERAVHAVIEAAPGLVVVDEAYHAFAGKSFLSQVKHYPNLLIMRTLSKLGLAGLRLGLLIGRPDWLVELDKVRLPYNVNVLTQAIAQHVLEQSSVLESQAAAIRIEREKMYRELCSIHGVRTYKSEANFLLFQVSGADAVHAGLKGRGVLIKNLHGSHPALSGCLRVTVGTPEENTQFMQALHESLRQAA
jgi:histidinol-phosphate aminotransferase